MYGWGTKELMGTSTKFDSDKKVLQRTRRRKAAIRKGWLKKINCKKADSIS